MPFYCISCHEEIAPDSGVWMPVGADIPTLMEMTKVRKYPCGYYCEDCAYVFNEGWNQ